MSCCNSVTLVGFVGSDPEQRQAKGNGSKFTVLSVATQRSWKNADDKWSSKVEWHRGVEFKTCQGSVDRGSSIDTTPH
jgi:single-stranded DNA-binding protein